MKVINEKIKYSLLKEIRGIKNANRESRVSIAKKVVNDDATFSSLLEIALEYHNEYAVKAMWIVEYICEQRMDLLAIHFNYFIHRIQTLSDENISRSASKICNLVAKSYVSKIESPIQIIATEEQISILTEISFHWLQNDYKVAIKANAMETLYELGKAISWIHYELNLVLIKNISFESPSFKTKATNILKALSKNAA